MSNEWLSGPAAPNAVLSALRPRPTNWSIRNFDSGQNRTPTGGSRSSHAWCRDWTGLRTGMERRSRVSPR